MSVVRNGLRNPWWTLAVLGMADFMIVLDTTIVNVALPSIQSSLGFSAENLQWVISVYTLVFGGFLLLGGRGADLLGRRLMFVAGLALFGAASLAAGLSVTPGMLVALRAVQGLGAALLSPAAFSILQVTFTQDRERNLAMGVWGGLAGLGGTLGAVLGGLLIDALSWRWVFFVNVPVVAALAAAAFPLLRETREPAAGRTFDVAGAALSTAGLLSIMLAVTRASATGWTSREVITLLLAGALLLGLFLLAEHRSPGPLVPLRFFKSRGLITGTVGLAMYGASFLAMFFLTVLLLQEGRGLSPLTTAMDLLPMGATAIIGAVAAGQLASRAGTRRVQILGSVLLFSGFLLLSRASASSGYATSILPGLLLTGAGITSSSALAQIAAVAGIAPGESGAASGLVQAGNEVGSAIGLAVITTLAASRDTAAGPAGHTAATALVGTFRFGMSIAAVIAAVSVLVTLLTPSANAAQTTEAGERGPGKGSSTSLAKPIGCNPGGSSR